MVDQYLLTLPRPLASEFDVKYIAEDLSKPWRRPTS
jgi:hypothetical protein